MHFLLSLPPETDIKDRRMNRRVVLSSSLFAVMLFGIICSTLFIHSHIYKGYTIVHSHPTSDSTSPHSHDEASFDTISRIATAEATSVECCDFVVCLPLIIEQRETIAYHIDEGDLVQLRMLRAPPALA